MDTKINLLFKPDIGGARVIEGLPGVGHVGKLAAEHLIDCLDAEKFAEVYSSHLPPQVLIEDGEAQLVNIELFVVEERNLVIIVGDHQAVDNEGHYIITEKLLDLMEETVDPSFIYTLGGFGTGEILEKPKVLGAVSTKDLKTVLKDAGAIFEENRPGGGIVGASGLLLGFSKMRDIKAACLMGETSGYLVDPRGAKSVLEVLSTLIGIEIDLEELDKKADELEEVVSQMMKQVQQDKGTGSEDLAYIG